MLTKPREKKFVVFLCTGDTCRGPMAQGYMKHRLDELGWNHIEVRTAGVMTVAGLVPTPEARQVMDREGVDISKHRSAPLTPELIYRADLILGMTPYHVQAATRVSDLAKSKTHLLKEFTQSDLKNYQVSDPMGATLEVYKRVFREIKLAVDKLLEHDWSKTNPAGEHMAAKAKPAPEPEKKPAAAPAKGSAKTATNGKASTSAPAKTPAKPTPKVATKAAPPAKKKVAARS